MKAASLAFISFLPSVLGAVVHDKRSGFKDGQPISDNGKGAPLLGKTETPKPSKLPSTGSTHALYYRRDKQST